MRVSAHLSLALLQLRDTFAYLNSQQITCYRLPDVLPLGPTADFGLLQAMIDESADLAAEVGALAHQNGMRLSIHPGLHVALASPHEAIAQRAAEELKLHARLLDELGCGPEGVIIVHVGGAHGNPTEALQRFASRYEQLPERVRRRVVVEADEHSFDVATLLWLARCCGTALVFDSLHFQLNNPSGMPACEALALALATWFPGVRPEIHFSSQRTEAHLRPGRNGAPAHIVPPRRGQHADYLNPFEFVAFMREARGSPPFDIMLEAKAADLALLRLRDDLRDFAPDIAGLEAKPGVDTCQSTS